MGIYRDRGTVLDFGAKLYGEELVCEARIQSIKRDSNSIVVELLSDDGAENWMQTIPLAGARFEHWMCVEPGGPAWRLKHRHSVLVLSFKDATLFFFAERLPERPDTDPRS